MVKKGKLGKLSKLYASILRDTRLRHSLVKQKRFQTGGANPKIAGVSNCMGDIGTHAENLVHYISGLEIDSLCADLSVNIPGRTLMMMVMSWSVLKVVLVELFMPPKFLTEMKII